MTAKRMHDFNEHYVNVLEKFNKVSHLKNNNMKLGVGEIATKFWERNVQI